jgi:hypothetical protein
MIIRPGALPLSQQIILDLLFPPVGAAIWWVVSTGWATIVQGGKISERTKMLRKRLFWTLLAGAYALMFGMTLYAYLT